MLKAYLHVGQTVYAGRGVFTTEKIAADTVIEISPVIVMSAEDRVQLDKTTLHDYIFEWGKDTRQCCMALGLVAMYNHSYASNCEYIMDYADELIFIQTVKDIDAGTELTINYNGDWNDASKIWFDTK